MTNKGREKFKVYKNVFDEFTRRTLFELESKGLFDEESLVPIAIGKEANVFWGEGKEGNIVLKIYRLQSCDFNRMYDYIKIDPRFSQLKRQRRKVIFGWAQREYRNLLKAREAQVSSPIPYAINNHVLALEMIGDEAPAMKIKDQPPKDPQAFFEEVVENVRRYFKAGYVHGDLSGFNILNHNENVVLIDFSQGTSLENPNAMEYLLRDIHNISVFFKRLGAKCDEEEMLKKIRS